MSDPISGIHSGLRTAVTSFTLPAAHQVTQHVPAKLGDTVTLSETAQVNQLNGLGESASLIAQSLGIPVTTVQGELGIVEAQSSSAPEITPTTPTRST